MNPLVQLGVVIPSYNEAENIASLVHGILQNPGSIRVMVVDDSPTSETAEAVRAMKLDRVQVIHRSRKGGRGSAVLEGLTALLAQRCDHFIEMDADFSHPPAQITELVTEGRQRRLDLLIASRYLPSSQIVNWALSRRIFSRVANFLARVTLAVPVSDYTNGFRYYSDAAAQMIVQSCGKIGHGFIALSEILVNVHYRGLKIGEIPTVFTNRVRGQSSVTTTEIAHAAIGLYRIARLRRQLEYASSDRSCS